MSYENSSRPFPAMLPDQEMGLHLITQLCVLPQRSNDPGTNAEVVLLQEGGPLPGPESGLSSNTWKWIVWWDTRADKARAFIGKACLGGEQRENHSITWPAASGFMVRGLVSGLSLASHLAWPICWRGVLPAGAHISAKVDSRVRVSGRLERLLPPTLPRSFRWQHLILYSNLLCETAQASGCHHAWPKWAGFVGGSLTVWQKEIGEVWWKG